MVKQVTLFPSTSTVKSEGESASAWQRRHQERAVCANMIRRAVLLGAAVTNSGSRSRRSTQGQHTPGAPLARQSLVLQRRGAVAMPRRQLSTRVQHQRFVEKRTEASQHSCSGAIVQDVWQVAQPEGRRCRHRPGSGSAFSWLPPTGARIAATCEKGFWFTTRKAV